MDFIKINDKEKLNTNAIRSYRVDSREQEVEHREPFVGVFQRVTDRSTKMETVLKIITNDDLTITLYGTDADAALAVLNQRTNQK